jgi:prepilin peptidase CpaA
MPLVEIARWAVLVLLTLILGYAAARDVKERRIPNWSVLAVMGLFVAWAFVGPSVSLLGSIEAAVIMFVLTVGLFMMKIVGAGDSKLVSAVALFVGIQHLLTFALLMSLAGGAIAAFMLALSPKRALMIVQTRGQVGFGRSVPYGAAIALATVATVVPQVTGIPQWWG